MNGGKIIQKDVNILFNPGLIRIEIYARGGLRDVKGIEPQNLKKNVSKERARFCLLFYLNTIYIFSGFLLTPLLRFTLVYNPLLGLSFVAVYWAIGLYHAYSV